MLVLDLKQKQDTGLVRCGRSWLEKKEKKEQLIKQVIIQNQLYVKGYFIGSNQDLKVVDQVSGVLEKHRC